VSRQEIDSQIGTAFPLNCTNLGFVLHTYLDFFRQTRLEELQWLNVLVG
jgi:hypothetical protein